MEERLQAQAIANARAPLRPLHRSGGGHPHGRILLVEDEPDQAAILEAVLRAEGLDVVVATSGEQALELHHRTPADVLVTDLNLPGMTGVELMRRLSPPVNPESTEPVTPPPAVVVVTGQSTVSSAIEALKLGAADYLQKPLDPARLVSLVRELLASDNVREADNEAEDEHGALVFEGMVGGSKKMRDVFDRIERVAATMAPVLIVGESGTGKELVARAIHNRSRRRNGPFVPVHTGAIPKELIGSELFGHEKGSFTGAFNAAEGKFEAAATGTVFLDEVGTMDTPVQVSLLRVLETYRFTRVGGRKEIEADVRIVAATNRDLLDLVDEGTFREDLYYRLNVFTVALPPLRERREDIMSIADRFLGKYAKRYGTAARRFSKEAIDRLNAYDWPGNVRELRNVVEQTALFAPGEVVQASEIQLDQGRIERRGSHRRGAEAQTPPVPPTARSTETDPVEAAGAPASSPPSDLREITPRSESDSARASTPMPSPVAAPALERVSPVPPAPSTVEPARARADEEDHPLVLRLPVGTRLADAERKLILLTLEAVRGNKQRAARVLGISRRGLYSKLQAYGEHVTAADAAEAAEAAENEANADDDVAIDGAIDSPTN
jgi:DNA-binding NtrC family response regulator